MLESPWFLDFLSYLLDTAWWGGSLFQFGIDEGGWLSYDLIPRKHVDPIRKLILRMQTDIHGTAWDEYDNLLFVGKPRALGELIKDIPWVLDVYKRQLPRLPGLYQGNTRHAFYRSGRLPLRLPYDRNRWSRCV